MWSSHSACVAGYLTVRIWNCRFRSSLIACQLFPPIQINYFSKLPKQVCRILFVVLPTSSLQNSYQTNLKTNCKLVASHLFSLDTEEQFYVLQLESVDDLAVHRELLTSTEPLKSKVDRNLQVSRACNCRA